MTILGVLLLILGIVFAVKILFWIGVVLLVVGGTLWLLHALGRGVGGRRLY